MFHKFVGGTPYCTDYMYLVLSFTVSRQQVTYKWMPVCRTDFAAGQRGTVVKDCMVRLSRGSEVVAPWALLTNVEWPYLVVA